MASNEGKKRIIGLVGKDLKEELIASRKKVRHLEEALFELRYGNPEEGLKEYGLWQ